MKFFIWLSGNLRNVWPFIKALIASEAGKFLADPETQAIALDAVERATKLDLNGDGKFLHATNELKERCILLGKKYYIGWLSVVVQAAYEKLKAETEDLDATTD